MSERNALYRSILAAPDDDAPRLIFADWLDEHNEPKRAEYIRVQCAMAREERHSPKYRKLVVRARQLFDFRWNKTMKGKAIHCEFARGFIDRITIFSKRFMTLGDDIFSTEPVRVVKLGNVAAERGNVPLSEFAYCPHLARLRGLDLSLSEQTSQLLMNLGQGGQLRNLRELTINASNHVGEQFLDSLTACGMDSLEALFWGRATSEDAMLTRPDWSLEDLHQLARWKGVKTLKTLELPDILWTPEKIAALAAVPFEALECLNLGGMHFYYPNNPENGSMGSEGLKVLAQSPHMRNLTELVVPHHNIMPDGIRALANSPYIKNLRRLHLQGNNLGNEGVRMLIESPSITGLYWLNVVYCSVNSADHVTLAALKAKFPDAVIHTT